MGKQLSLVMGLNTTCCGTWASCRTSSSQVHLPSCQGTTGRGLVFSSGCKGYLLRRVSQCLLNTSWGAVGRWAKGLIGGRGGGHLLIEQVTIAVSHHVSAGGIPVGHGGHGEGLLAARLLDATAAAAVSSHESGKLWLLGVGGRLGWPSLWRRAHRHPAGVRVAILVALPGAFASHGYVRQRPGVYRKQRRRKSKSFRFVWSQREMYWMKTKIRCLLWYVSWFGYYSLYIFLLIMALPQLKFDIKKNRKQ